MITLTAQINLLSNLNDNAISFIDTMVEGNNISANINKVANIKAKGSNPFLLGVSKFNEGATFSNGVPYFISSDISNENSEFDIVQDYEITTSGQITDITLVFDDYNNNYPTEIELGYESTTQIYKNDDPVATIILKEPTDSIEIKITKWNKPNRPFVLQGVYIGLTLTIDRKNMLSIKSDFVDRSNLKLPSFGIISNTGNIEFNDFDGEVQDYIQDKIISENLHTDIFIKNTLTNKKEKIGSFNKSKWKYSNSDKVVTVMLKDDLEEWQEINIQGINYDARNPKQKSFKEIFQYLYEQTPSKYNMQKFTDLDSATQNVLTNTYIKYPLLDKSTLWVAWQKLCETLQLHIFKDRNGVTVCRYNGGN